MAYSIAITDEGWNLVSQLFDPPGRRGAPATTDRRQMVDAILFLARTGCRAWLEVACVGYMLGRL